MITYSKVPKGTSKPTETTTGNRNENNIILLSQNTHGTVSLTLNIHGMLQQKSNARKAQSIVVAKYPWFGAAEIKILSQEGTVYPSR